jgi:hypothetical protein
VNNGAVYQYEITSSKITLINSSNNVVTSRLRGAYTLNNGKITTQGTRHNKIQDLEVLKVTASTMQLRPLPATGDTLWNLVRIDPSKLVGRNNNSVPVDETINMKMETPSLQFSKSYKRTAGSDNGQDDFVDLRCSYDEQSQVFTLNLNTFRRGMDPKKPERRNEASLTLSGIADFETSAEYDTAHFAITNSSQQQGGPGFLAQFSPPRSRDIYFSLSRRKGRCDVGVNRLGDAFSFSADCTNVDANGDNIEGNSRVRVDGTCTQN